MKKIICMLIVVFALSIGTYSVVEATSLNSTTEVNETYGVIEYNVSSQYISRQGWGYTHTISIQNTSDRDITVYFTAKGCNGERDSASIRPYGRGQIWISTGDAQPTGWAISIY